MSQPVKISDDLVLDARVVGEVLKRSIAGQIEFWAQLGRAIEPLLEGELVLALQKAGRVKPLSACLATVDSPNGRRRLAEVLNNRPYPHYESIPGRPGLLVRIDQDGKKTKGRFVNRRFKVCR